MRKTTIATLTVMLAVAAIAAACSNNISGAGGGDSVSPNPSQTAAVSPEPSAAPSASVKPSASPAAKPSPSAKPSPAPSPKPAASAKPSGGTAQADNKPISWYYMKGKKGQVPSFPVDIKKYKDTDKALWVGKGKTVYLTFDNGGPMGDTKKLLKTLKDNGVRANFFLAGYNMKAHADFVKQLVADGHLVGNHTMSHKDMTTLSDDQVKKEIDDYSKMYKEITGKPVPMFFRFPYGKYSLHLLDLVSDMGYTSVFWSTAMKDWEPRKNGADDAFNDVINNLHEGNIILLHQGSQDNIDALDRILKGIKKEGYSFGLLTGLQS